MFKKKAKNVEKSLAAVDARILEFQKKKDSRAKDIAEKKQEIGSLLATLAIEPTDKAEESLKLAKKALERMTDSYNDVSLQVGFLSDHRKQLEKEFLAAQTRDLPGEMEKHIKAFNETLEVALGVMDTFKDVYDKMKASETTFISLCKE